MTTSGPATMKAAVYHEYGDSSVLSIEEVPVPNPAPGEVLIRVRAAGVNPVDWKLRRGLIPIWPASFPCIPGWDVAGTVAATGTGCTRFALGDAVYAYARPFWEENERETIRDNGCCAEYVAVPEARVCAKPAQASFEEAGAVPLAGLTAWQGLFDHAGLQAGERVLILNASGGVGSFAVQFAKAAGATVIGTCSPANFEFVQGLGADTVLDYRAADLAEQARAVGPIDRVLDCVGDEHTEPGIAAVREGGVVVSIANWEVAERCAAAGARCTGKVFLVHPSAEQLARIAEWIDRGLVRVAALKVMPLAAIAEAHDAVETHHTRGKIVLVP